MRHTAILTALLMAAPAFAVHAPQSLSIGGQLFAADGTEIAQPSVNFRIQIYDATETCILYSEDHLGEDLSTSKGHFNLILGTGTSKTNNVGAAGQLDGAVFTNRGSTAVASCPSSPMNLAPGQERQIHVLYDLGSGFVTMSPAVPLVSSAYAMVADSLSGLSATDFIQVNGTSSLNQANQEYAFSLTNWPRLKALLDGTSSQYLPSTPTVPLDVNGQRITDLADPTAAQDAATKHYVDTNVGGRPLDLTGVGPMTGGGSTLVWDQTANKWVAGTVSSSPTGTAGGDLTGTYPNPTIANDKITSAKLSSTGIAVNRLVITNATDGTTLGFGTCPVVGEVYAWTAGGWACTSVSTLAPVTSVAGKTGVVTLNAADISGLGTAALYNWGTAASQIVRLDASARLPAVDGSQLTNVNAVQLQGRDVASTAPSTGQVLSWNGSAWTPVALASGSVSSITSGTGLLGGPITATGTLSVDVGTTANKILQLNASAQLPAVDGSLLTQINAVTLQSRAIASTAPTAGQVLGWNATSTRWEPTSAAAGSVTSIATANGILGGPITGTGTLSIDTGTAANKILQLNASAQIPAVDGSLLTQINAVTLQSRVVASVAPGAGQVLGWNAASTQWEPTSAATGSVTNVASGVGLVGGPITSSGTLNVDVGTAANKILQLNASAQVPAVDGSLLTHINAVTLQTRAVSATAPTSGQSLTWNATSSQWEPSTASGGTVLSVASGAGLLGGPITSTGTLNVDVGTAANKILQLNGTAQIPAVDGSLLTHINAVTLQSRAVASAAPGAGQVLGWNAVSTQWEPTSAAAGSVTNVASGVGLLGGPITSSGTLNVDVGTAANKILQLNASAQVPAVDGSLLTHINAVTLQSRAVASAAPGAGQVLGWNATSTQWEPTSAAAGSVTSVASGVGLLGGPITSNGTLNVDVGTAANKIVQLNASAQVPAVDGSLLTNVNAVSLQSRAISAVAPTAGQVLSWNAAATQWQPTSGVAGNVTGFATGTGLLGGPITTTGTISVDVGSAAGKIVQENANAQIAQMPGSAALPGYTFAGTNNTGVFSPASGTLALATAGTARLTIDPTGNVGVGTASPTAALDVRSNSTGSGIVSTGTQGLGATSGGGLAARTSAFATAPDQRLGGIFFGGTDGTDLEYGAGIFGYSAQAYSTTQSASYLTFETAPLGSQIRAVRMQIGADGTVGVGTGAPAALLDVYGTGAQSALLIPRDSTTNRPTGVNGMLRYNTSTNAFEGFANNQWSTIAAGTAAGSVTSITNGTGLLGGPITTSGTLSVNVGTAANQIVQLTSTAQVAPNGAAAAAPAYAFSGNLNSGMYSPGAGQLAFAANGTSALYIAASGNVGLGTTTAVQRLTIDSAQDTYLDFSQGGVDYLKMGRADSGGAIISMLSAGSEKVKFDSRNTNPSFIDNGGSFGIGTINPQAALDVALTGTVSAIIVPRDTTGNRPGGVNGMIRYNTTNNGLEGFINGSWSTLAAGSSAGTVTGIATGTGLLGGPITTTGTLSVNVGTAPNQVVQENATGQIAQSRGVASLPTYSFAGNTNTGVFSPAANQIALSTNGTAALTVNAAGQVGVGTANPQSTLDVYGSGGAVMAVTNTGTTGLAMVGITSYGAGQPFLQMNQARGSSSSATATQAFDNLGTIQFQGFNGSANVGGSFIAATAEAAFNATTAPTSLLLFTTGTATSPVERVRLTGAGNVGVGTQFPQGAMDVFAVGTSSALLVPRDTGTNRPAGVNGMIRYNTTANAFEGYQAGSWTNLVSAGGSTTFPLLASPGTTGASAPSYSFTGNTNTGFYSPATNQLAFATNGTAAMTISAAGNVGIGQATPLVPLDVAGYSRVVSAGNGNMTTLGSDITSGTTTYATVNSTSGFPAAGYIMIDAEFISYTSKTSTRFSGLSRGQLGSSAAAHYANTAIYQPVSVISNSGGPVFSVASSGATRIGNISSNASLAVGDMAYASANSLAVANGSYAYGGNGAAIGTNAQTGGPNAIALGEGTNAPARSQVAVGNFNAVTGTEDSFNWVATDPIFTVGIGQNGTPKTGVTVLKNGNFGIGTMTPSVLLHVVGGAIVSSSTGTTSASVDFTKSNVITSSVSATALNVCGLRDGGAYSLILTGLTNGAAVSITAYELSNCTGTTSTVDMGAGATSFNANGNTTILNFIYAKTTADGKTLYGTASGGFNVR